MQASGQVSEVLPLEPIIDKWNSTQPQPTPQEIRDEYIRQQTIAECLEHFKNINK